MKKLIPIVFLLIIGCTENPKRKSIDESQFTEHHLEFLNGTIILPKSYKKTTGNKLAMFQSKTLNQPELEDYLTGEYQKLEANSPFGNAIFMDTTNVQNYIFIRLGEYVPLNKTIANQYLRMIKGTVEKDWNQIGIKYERIANKFIQTDKSDYIKIKYRTTKNGSTTFQTQFLMSNNLKTFDFLVVNTENKEVENWIKRTVIK